MTVTEQYRGYIANTFNMSDLIESVAVIQSPINSRYGNSDGGIITMVTSKGSNTFTGTLRANVGRNNWGVNGYTNYPRRDGTIENPTGWRTTDDLTRSYEVTIKGPIWKDHITFAYGANLTPTTYSSRNAYIRWFDNGDGTFGRPEDSVGTYFMQTNPNLPGYGDVIRKAEMYTGNDPYDRLIPTTSYSKNNQFSAIAQITSSHQIEWNYSQRDAISTNGGQGTSTRGEPWDRAINGTRAWSTTYKGVIGSYGVLEVRYGKTYIYNENGFGMANPTPIRTYTVNSYISRNLTPDPNDPNNYYANGIVEADARQSQNQWLEDPTNFYNPQADYYYWTHNGPWSAPSSEGAGGNTATVLNYQHFLNTSKGSHIIDLGFQRDSYNWQKSPAGPMLQFYSPGHIARNLGPGDIWNSLGNPSAAPSAYADHFIVYDVTKAWLSDISPWGVAKYKIRDMPVYAPTTYPNRVHPLLGNADPRYPMVQQRFGESSGEFLTNMTSYYINDLWSINDHHSIQGGLRIDNFELVDGGTKAVGYTQPTLRFEYKWDIHGDQSRLVNVSWGQFHSQIPTGTFRPMIESPGSNTQRRYWNRPNPDGSRGNPYLVTREELMNIDNYGEIGPQTLYGGMMYRVDPSWKAPISTEIQAGFRRNLFGGGYWRATFVYRTWINDFDFHPEPSEMFQPTLANGQLGQLNIRRYMRNNEGYSRKYTSLELEWDYPIHKRFTTGGSYTFSRLMSNVPGTTDAANDIGDAPGMNFASYWDWTVGSRDVWAPSVLNGREHYIKFYLLFDISSGKIKSSVSFTGNYASGSPYRDSFTYNFGFPVEFDPRYSQLIVGTSGGSRPNTAGTSGFGSNLSIPINLMSTSQDEWYLSMRYLLTVPLARNISWLSTIVINNPFNHRGIGPWFSTSSPQGVTIPKQLTGNSTTNVAFPYGGSGPADPGVWLAYYDTVSRLNNLYVSRQSGRSFSVQTGLRF
jgi:hypothetical protein